MLCLWLLHGFWGFKLRSLFLCGEHFTRRAMSPAPHVSLRVVLVMVSIAVKRTMTIAALIKENISLWWFAYSPEVQSVKATVGSRVASRQTRWWRRRGEYLPLDPEGTGSGLRH